MPLSSSVRGSLEEATATYEMFQGEVHSYLGARGIDPSLAATFRLGYVAVPVVGHEQFLGRLAIPYLTRAGVVNIKFRCIEHLDCKEHNCSKYLALPGLSGRLFNVNAFFQEGDYIGITEGEFDAMVLDGYAGIPAVAVPGAQNWRRFYYRCFQDYSKVFIFADGDDAGKAFAKEVSSFVDGATVVSMPLGTDVNSVYVAEGSEGLRKRAGLNE